jgi:hypothetical protein
MRAQIDARHRELGDDRLKARRGACVEDAIGDFLVE